MESFGPYDLIEPVGRGGMGVVYRARHRNHGRDVAVKVLAPSGEADQEYEARFRRECYLAASLNDPHVIPIHAYGEIEGRLYLEMRLVEGVDLARVLQHKGVLPVNRALSLLGQAASALDAAHARGLVHRDVKPSNLLVTPNDFVYLVDFGIAQAVGTGAVGAALTATGAAIGTLAYMAPERFESRPSVPATDTYALACVLFEAVSGRPPFREDSLPAMMRAHLVTPPPPLSSVCSGVPQALDEVIAAGMAKDPTRRPTPAMGLIEAAQSALGPELADRRRGSRAETLGQPAGPPRFPNHRRAPSQAPSPGPVPVQPAKSTFVPPAAPVGASARRPRRRSSVSAWFVAIGILAAASILVAAVVLASASTGSADADQLGAGGSTAPTTTGVPSSGGGGTRPSGDLGLTRSISTPACAGGVAVIVKSAVDQSRYRQDVSEALARYPAASYVLTETSCASLDPRDATGNPIYAVYLGPFDTVVEACSVRATVGGDSYLRRLDSGTTPGTTIDCG